MKKLGMLLLTGLLFGIFGSVLAQDAAASKALGLYYNPYGGKYYHVDPNCASVSAEYLPLKPLPPEKQGQMPACPYCAGSPTPIFSVSGGSANMPNLQVDVYLSALKGTEADEDKVYRLHITDKDRPTHAFADLLYTSMENGDGLAAMAGIEDMNFDGYPDVKGLRAMGASNISSAYFLYSPADGQFHYEPVFDALSAYALYPEQKLISNSIHDSAETGIRELYRIREDGRPMLARRASVLYDPQSDWKKIRIKVTSYDEIGAETVLSDEVREGFTGEADYRESEQKWLGLLYQGIPEAVVKSELGG